ncbi:MAG: AraC family transcriptional regulator [Sphingomicrobium sp.]
MVDVLSDVLRAIRLKGAVFVDVDAKAPWSARTPSASTLLPMVMPGADHLMSFHLVTQGTVWAVTDSQTLELGAGTIIVFPQGKSHVVCSDPALPRGQGIDPFRLKSSATPPYRIKGGGAGSDRSRMVCGFFGCDAKPFNPLLAALPEVITGDAASKDAGDLGVFYRLAASEAHAASPGGAATLVRLCELMLIEAIRRYLRTSIVSEGWLAGLTDPQIGRALVAIHTDPTRSWTVETLAGEAALSRTVFADRFNALIHRTPMAYVASWRLQLAALRLAEGGTVAAAAAEAGYDGEASFSRAFKRSTGQSPARWGKHRREAVARH